MRFSVEKSDEIVKFIGDYQKVQSAYQAAQVRVVEKHLENLLEFVEETVTELLTDAEFEEMDEWTVANNNDVVGWLLSVKKIEEEVK